MSRREQMQQQCTRKGPALLDHLVGARKQRRRHGEPERFGGLEVDHQLELGRLENRQIGRLLALENPADIDAGLAIAFGFLPQHFKHEVEHTIAGLSPEEVQARLAESRAKLLDAGIDLEALPVVEALPAPEGAK
jgi:hypothetical protein